MKLVGFNFSKIGAEKYSKTLVENLKVNTNIDIADVKDVKSDVIQSKESLLGVDFSYEISYEPKFAKIFFSGMVLVSMPAKEAELFIKEWAKKSVPEEFRLPLFNVILKKCNLKALQLEEEINLPSHVPLPSVKPAKNSAQGSSPKK